MMAASPVWELNKIYDMLGFGEKILQGLSFLVVLVSALSVFVALFGSLRARRYELALMRSMGAGRFKVFGLIILEGLFIAILGTLLGILLAHGALWLLSGYIESEYKYLINPLRFDLFELVVFTGGLLIGLFAALLPAISASLTDIADTLTRG